VTRLRCQASREGGNRICSGDGIMCRAHDLHNTFPQAGPGLPGGPGGRAAFLQGRGGGLQLRARGKKFFFFVEIHREIKPWQTAPGLERDGEKKKWLIGPGRLFQAPASEAVAAPLTGGGAVLARGLTLSRNRAWMQKAAAEPPGPDILSVC